MASADASPWLSIPAGDYEAHMASPAVQQQQYLNAAFRKILAKTRPRALAVLGCATGNGFEHIPPQTQRVVAVDLNPAYLEALRDRFAGRIPGLEMVCADVTERSLSFDALDLVHCALLFEYVPPEGVVERIAGWLQAGGVLAVVLQLPAVDSPVVTETPYTSLKALEPIMRLVEPERITALALRAGLGLRESRVDALATGKRFHVAWYARE